MRRWYKDRDFPEIKAQRSNEPSEILAVVEKDEDIKRLIEEHNLTIDQFCAVYTRSIKLELALEHAREVFALMADGEGSDSEVYRQMSRRAVEFLDKVDSKNG